MGRLLFEVGYNCRVLFASVRYLFLCYLITFKFTYLLSTYFLWLGKGLNNMTNFEKLDFSKLSFSGKKYLSQDVKRTYYIHSFRLKMLETQYMCDIGTNMLTYFYNTYSAFFSTPRSYPDDNKTKHSSFRLDKAR